MSMSAELIQRKMLLTKPKRERPRGRSRKWIYPSREDIEDKEQTWKDRDIWRPLCDSGPKRLKTR